MAIEPTSMDDKKRQVMKAAWSLYELGMDRVGPTMLARALNKPWAGGCGGVPLRPMAITPVLKVLMEDNLLERHSIGTRKGEYTIHPDELQAQVWKK